MVSLRKIVLLIMSGCFCFAAFARQSVFGLLQDPVDRGDQLFNEFSFASAIEAYKKGLSSSEQPEDSIELKIAEGYRMLNQPEEAEGWYNKAIDQNSDVNPKYLLHYADVLSSQKKYAEAKLFYEAYSKKKAEDSRGNKKLETLNNQKEFYRNAAEVTINKVSFNSKAADFSPVITNDGILFVSARASKDPLGAIFNWDRSNYLDLFIFKGHKVKRLDKTINSKLHEGPAVLYDNGNKMIFTRNNNKNGKVSTSEDGVTRLKLFYTEKTERGWSDPEDLPFNSDEYSVGHPAISSDGATLYFASDMPGGYGGVDIYKSVMDNGTWQKPLNLGGQINTEGNELFPSIYKGKELYFASNGHGGLGALDIFMADVSKRSVVVHNVGAPINGPLDDFGITMGPEGNNGYFSSNRDGSGNNDDIYQFTTTRPLVVDYQVKGKVYDERSEEPLPMALVWLVDEEGNIIKSVKTDSLGNYSISVRANKSYFIKTDIKDYLGAEKPLVTTKPDTKKIWEIDLPLTKDLGFSLRGLVTGNTSGDRLDSVKVTILDNLSNKVVLESETTSGGMFNYPIQKYEINDRISYQIKLEKEGYLSKSLVYNALLENPGVLDVNADLNLSLDKLEIGTDIGKLIDIQPIYFDVGKHNIRPDAAEELNKIVSIMQENPSIEIELGSHTDSRGNAALNLRLSDKRAKTSAEYIISQGISPKRIVGKGYGETQLINKCADGVPCSAAEHQLNRRTEFKISKY